MTGESRNIVSKYNTSTHFKFGQHSTIHYSEAKLKTILRPGLSNGHQGNSGSSLTTCGSNFQIGTGKISAAHQFQTTYNRVTGNTPAAEYYVKEKGNEVLPAKITSINFGKGGQRNF